MNESHETKCGDKITARDVAKWIQSLPDEFQDAEIRLTTAFGGSHPITSVFAIKPHGSGINATDSRSLTTK